MTLDAHTPGIRCVAKTGCNPLARVTMWVLNHLALSSFPIADVA